MIPTQPEPAAIQIAPQDMGLLEQGLLGDGQRQLLRRQRLAATLGSLSGLIIALTLALLLSASLARVLAITAGAGGIALAVGISWLWLLRRAPQQWWQIGSDLSAGSIAAIEGSVRCTFHLMPGMFPLLSYAIIVSERRFAVSRAAYEQFSNQRLYRVFYAPASGLFLGALALPQPAVAQPPPQLAQAVDSEGYSPGPLTAQELAILQLIAAGRSNKEIAQALSLSVNTIKMYASQIYRKLGVQRRTEAVEIARRSGLI
jgi:DNA-binding CsgD family transcriptional regulator